MRRKSTENNEKPILNVVGDLVGLGPLRRDLLPLYQRWINDLGTMRTLGLAPLPMTSEKEQEWYDRQSKAEEDVPFTIFERETLRPIGNTGLHGVDHRNRSATFGILIGEPECRGKGYGTETTRLMLDYAFTALGLHNVMLTVFEFNPAGSGSATTPAQSPALVVVSVMTAGIEPCVYSTHPVKPTAVLVTYLSRHAQTAIATVLPGSSAETSGEGCVFLRAREGASHSLGLI